MWYDMIRKIGLFARALLLWICPGCLDFISAFLSSRVGAFIFIMIWLLCELKYNVRFDMQHTLNCTLMLSIMILNLGPYVIVTDRSSTVAQSEN